MEDLTGELKTFINIWFIAVASTCYCYFIPPRISGGLPRFPKFFLLHWTVIIVLYFSYMHIGLELGFAITAFLVKTVLGFHFRIEPYLATSVWGRPWNLMASSILRTTMYNQTRVIFTPTLGRLLAVFVAFVASGLMHELIFLYSTRVGPTWEVTLVVALHCLVVEVVVNKAVNGDLRLHRAVGGPLTVVFVAVTGGWMLLWQVIRNGVMSVKDHKRMFKSVGNVYIRLVNYGSN